MYKDKKKTCRKALFRGKRGNWADIPEFIYFAITFFILASFTMVIINNFDTKVQSMDESVMSNTSKNISTNYKSQVPTGLDMLFLSGVMIFFVVSIIFARIIPSDPKFMFLAFFFLIFFPILAMIIENIYDGFIQQSLIASANASFTFIPFILSNLVYFVLFYSLSVGIALYTKGGE